MTNQSAYNQELISAFRAARAAGDEPMPGRPLLLLTTTGAKSGQPRITPLMYVALNDQLLIMASNAGAPRDPDWYHNLVAHPAVTVEVGRATFGATAVILAGPAHTQAWQQIVAQYPFFAEHQAKVERTIPVVALHRQDDHADAH